MFRLFLLSALLVAVRSLPVAPVVDVSEDTLGNYRFEFNSGDYIRHETRDQNGHTIGTFVYVTPDGKQYTVEYEGGAELGLIAKGGHLPVSVTDTFENVQAKQEHFNIFNAVDSLPQFRSSIHDDDESPISPHEYLAKLQEQIYQSAPLPSQPDTPEIAALKAQLLAAHTTAIGH